VKARLSGVLRFTARCRVCGKQYKETFRVVPGNRVPNPTNPPGMVRVTGVGNVCVDHIVEMKIDGALQYSMAAGGAQ